MHSLVETLRSLRWALRDDVLVIDRDTRLPFISLSQSAHAYRTWSTLQTLLDPPSWLPPALPPLVRLVAAWDGADEGLLGQWLADLGAMDYPHFEVDLILAPGVECPIALREHRAAWLRVGAPGTPLDDAFVALRGDFVGTIDVGDRLAPNALHELVAGFVAAAPEVDVAYADEDWLGPHGPFLPHLKPELAPDTLRSSNYIGRPWLIRRETLVAMGGMRFADLGPAAEYDLMLRLVERGAAFVHVPRVLYRWRLADRPPRNDARFERALAAHLVRAFGGGTVEPALHPGTWRARPRLRTRPRVSIVIPNRDQRVRLAHCLTSLATSSYPDIEVVIVENGSTDPAIFDDYRALERDGRARVVPVELPSFNFSTLVQRGVARATGEVLVLLNNDTTLLTPDWIQSMLEHAQRPEVGAVGARLLYPSGAVQHAGIVLGPGGLGGHLHRGQPGHAAGYAYRLATVHNVSAVTAACMMIRRDVWNATGGFDERLPVAYNDVDFCLRLRARGMYVVQTPYAELIHHEHATRGLPSLPADVEADQRGRAVIAQRWRRYLDRDPYLPRDFSAAWLLCGGR